MHILCVTVIYIKLFLLKLNLGLNTSWYRSSQKHVFIHAAGAEERRCWLFSQVQNDAIRLCSFQRGHWSFFQVTPCLLWPSLSASFYCTFFFFFLGWKIIGVKSDLNDSSKATKWIGSLWKTKDKDTDPCLCPSQMTEVLLLALWPSLVANFGPVHGPMHLSKIPHRPVCSHTATQLFPCLLAHCCFLQANVVKSRSAG